MQLSDKKDNNVSFAKNNDDVISMSSSNISNGQSNSKAPNDPELRIKRKKQVISLVLLLLVIGFVVFFIIRSCIPKYTIINPTSISCNEKNLFLKINPNSNNPEYEISVKNNSNINVYYYYSGYDHDDYNARVVTTSGKVVQFKLREQTIDNKTVYLVGGEKIINSDNWVFTYNWLNIAVANATIDPPATNVWYIILQLLPTVVMIGLLVWFWFNISKMSGVVGKSDDSIFGIGRSTAKIAKSIVKFSDVAGIEEEKNELIEIVDYLKNPEKYAAMGARTPRGVILYGPPGTGKTLLAKAVAGEASVPFFQANGSSFDDMLVGVGAKRVRDLFNRAKRAAPAIIFIDEIDSVASKRGRNDVIGGSSGIADQTINQLLAEMDGFNTKTGVVVMAATNRLDALDEAILRPGRFDRHIQVNLPDIKEREAILKIHARNKNISNSVNLTNIARRTPGFSGAQLENVLNEATLLTVRLGKTAIGMAEIDEAIDRVIAGPAKHSRVITEEEKKQIAYHEAGHALVGLHTKGGDVVEKITIIPRGAAAGYTLATPEKQELAIQKKSDLLAIVRTTLAGRASEAIIYGKDSISTGASNDLYKVTNIVRSMVSQLGMSDVGMTQFIPSQGVIPAYAQKTFSEVTNQKIDKEIEHIIQFEYHKAKSIIKNNLHELNLIVETLLLLETIVKDQIDFIHKKLQLPPEAQERKKNLASEKN